MKRKKPADAEKRGDLKRYFVPLASGNSSKLANVMANQDQEQEVGGEIGNTSKPSTHESANVVTHQEEEQEVEGGTRNSMDTDAEQVEDSVELDIASLAKKMVELERHIMFPTVYRLIELAMLLPVATATVERAFSAMKIIKTELRNKMSDGWLNDLMVCYIERGIFKSIDLGEIKKDF